MKNRKQYIGMISKGMSPWFSCCVCIIYLSWFVYLLAFDSILSMNVSVLEKITCSRMFCETREHGAYSSNDFEQTCQDFQKQSA